MRWPTNNNALEPNPILLHNPASHSPGREDWRLVKWILESISTLPREALAASDWNHREFPLPMMLTLLAFSYYKGVLESFQIANLCTTDPVLIYISGNKRIPGRVIRSFRRGHFDLIAAALAHLLPKAAARLERSIDSSENAPWVTMARERVHLATMLDTASLDV